MTIRTLHMAFADAFARVATLWRHFGALLASEQDRWFPVAVVAMCGGIGLYYALGDEPTKYVMLVACGLAFALGACAMRA